MPQTNEFSWTYWIFSFYFFIIIFFSLLSLGNSLNNISFKNILFYKFSL